MFSLQPPPDEAVSMSFCWTASLDASVTDSSIISEHVFFVHHKNLFFKGKTTPSLLQIIRILMVWDPSEQTTLAWPEAVHTDRTNISFQGGSISEMISKLEVQTTKVRSTVEFWGKLGVAVVGGFSMQIVGVFIKLHHWISYLTSDRLKFESCCPTFTEEKPPLPLVKESIHLPDQLNLCRGPEVDGAQHCYCWVKALSTLDRTPVSPRAQMSQQLCKWGGDLSYLYSGRRLLEEYVYDFICGGLQFISENNPNVRKMKLCVNPFPAGWQSWVHQQSIHHHEHFEESISIFWPAESGGDS